MVCVLVMLQPHHTVWGTYGLSTDGLQSGTLSIANDGVMVTASALAVSTSLLSSGQPQATSQDGISGIAGAPAATAREEASAWPSSESEPGSAKPNAKDIAAGEWKSPAGRSAGRRPGANTPSGTCCTAVT